MQDMRSFPTLLSTVQPLPEGINPGLQAIGDSEILNLEYTALFCSVRCPGDLILKTYDLARAMREAETPVIGGFQTPMEKECLRLLLRGNQPVVICPARSIDNMRVPRAWRPAIAEQRLLVLSSFPPSQRRPTVKLAAQRNDMVVTLASRVFIAYAALGGKTEELARKGAGSGKPLLTLDSPANANLIELGARVVEVDGRTDLSI
ncbi:MAG: hypothetical protein F4Z30_16950 [Gemmatimonadetes bacterium]|nr:hypothetical protein [Gemmatimonadota bacterium]